MPADSSSPDHGLGRFIDGANQATGIAKQCLAMDDLVGDAPPPDAIKCDVEGAEVEALRGAEKLLRTRHPWLICEMHSEPTKQVSCELLARFGYTVEMLDDNHALAVPKPEF